MRLYFAGLGSDGESHHQDTVITFNYDLVLEQALRSLRIPFNYGFRPSDLSFDESATWVRRQYRTNGLTILKLHGSMNWVGPLETPAFAHIPPGHALPGLSQVALYSEKISVYGRFGDLGEDSFTPLLLPPTWRKTFGSLLSPVWDHAVRALRDATRIIVIGYSAPVTDQHFQYLLAAGVMDNSALESVWFVNPSATDTEIRDRVEALFHRGRSGTGVGTRLRLVPQKTTEFFFSKGQLRKIGRAGVGLDAKLRLGWS